MLVFSIPPHVFLAASFCIGPHFAAAFSKTPARHLLAFVAENNFQNCVVRSFMYFVMLFVTVLQAIDLLEARPDMLISSIRGLMGAIQCDAVCFVFPGSALSQDFLSFFLLVYICLSSLYLHLFISVSLSLSLTLSLSPPFSLSLSTSLSLVLSAYERGYAPMRG